MLRPYCQNNLTKFIRLSLDIESSQELKSLSSPKIEPEKFAPPPPPSPAELAKRIAELIGTVMSAPPEALGMVKGILDKGAREIEKGPLPTT